MDFSRFPDNVFLQILTYLPFGQQVRLSRVDKNFCRMSTIVVSATKMLDLRGEDEPFRKLTSDSLSIYLNLCSNNLERVAIRENNSLVTIFSRFCFPRLIELDLGWNTISPRLFADLIRNNSRLQILNVNQIKIDSENCIDDYFGNVVAWNLETLKIGGFTFDVLHSLMNRCPNLKSLEIDYMYRKTSKLFDEFFAACPKLESLIVHQCKLKFKKLTHFWRLESLRELRVRNESWVLVDGEIISKAIRSFPRLEILEIIRSTATSQALAAFSRLLRNLSLTKEKIKPGATTDKIYVMRFYFGP